MRHRAEMFAAAMTVTAALAAACPAKAQDVDWQAVANRAAPAVYALEVGHAIPFRLEATAPDWLGTGFQMRLPDGTLEEVTAGHVVGYDTGSSWKTWGEAFVAPIGTTGYWHVASFRPSNTTVYWPADCAISTHIIQRRSVVDYEVWRYGSDPAVRGSIPLGDYAALVPGEQLLVLGNRSGDWDFHDDRPFVQVGTYEGTQQDVYESSDNPAWPSPTIPEALVIAGSFKPGDSGAPVINAQGQVVGVLAAVNDYEGFAVPLEPGTGLPVDGTAVQMGR